MSLLRNTLCLVDKTRYAAKKIVSIFRDDLVRTSEFGDFDVTLGHSNAQLITANRHRNITWSPTFTSELNNERITVLSNKPAKSERKEFNLDRWVVELDDRKLILKLKDSDEMFTLLHKVVVQAHIKLNRDEDKCLIDFPKLEPRFEMYDAKITSFSKSGEFTRKYPATVKKNVPVDQILRYGLMEDMQKKTTPNDEITEKPNDPGKVKLQFPMDVHLEGPQHMIKVKNTDDYFIINHIVAINAVKDPRLVRADTIGFDASKPDLLRIALECGVITLSTAGTASQMVFLKHEVDIVLDVDGKIPNISVCPAIKASIQFNENA